ncbi:hypothetical protein RJ55_06679 [Drechmeria coniospora]|nr:hypothetical protein RJ55_06679 [Drechmeria coniospora]
MPDSLTRRARVLIGRALLVAARANGAEAWPAEASSSSVQQQHIQLNRTQPASLELSSIFIRLASTPHACQSSSPSILRRNQGPAIVLEAGPIVLDARQSTLDPRRSTLDNRPTTIRPRNAADARLPAVAREHLLRQPGSDWRSPAGLSMISPP